ncbi:Replication factor C (RF-C) subunit, variant 2 [Bonamia ostreae]
MRFNLLNTQSILKRLKFIAEKEKIKNDEEGLKTIIELSKNDMRNCINILQCCWYGHNEINAENVYKSAGIPQKKSIDKIVEYLLNEEFHFCFKVISNFQVENGVSLDVLVALIFEKVQRIDFPENVLSFVIEKMAQTGYYLIKF